MNPIRCKFATAAHRASLIFFSLILFLGILLAAPLRAADNNDKGIDPAAVPLRAAVDNDDATDPPAAPPAATESKDNSAPTLWHQPYMFNWGPERQHLAEKGLVFTFFYAVDALGDKGTPKDVVEQFNGWYRLRGTVDVDFGKFTAAKGLSFHITGLFQGGQNMGHVIGSLVNPSGLVSVHTFSLDSAWLQQSLFDGRLVVTGGQMAAQDFYGLGYRTWDFLMEPFDYNFGIMGNAETSWDPQSGPGGNIKIFPIKQIRNFYFQAGVFSGRNYSRTGWTYYKKTPATYDSQVGYDFTGKTDSGKTYPGSYMVGAIVNNGEWNSNGVPAFVNSTTLLPTQTTYEVYFQTDQAIYRMDPGSDRGLNLIFGLAHSPDRVLDVVNDEYKMALTFNGPIPGRAKDKVSFGFVYSKIEGKYNDYLTSIGEPRLDDEKALEFNYKAQLTPWLVFQPTLQHYSSLGGVSGHEAYVAGFRLMTWF